MCDIEVRSCEWDGLAFVKPQFGVNRCRGTVKRSECLD
jgi:hypothetical protein